MNTNNLENLLNKVDEKICELEEEEKIKDKIYNKIKGSLIGGAVGDALGYPIEFMKIDYIKKKYGEKGITRFELIDDIAQISDDTQMTLFTANGLLFGTTRMNLKGIGANYENYIYMAYKDWYYAQMHKEQPKFIVSWLYNLKEMHSNRAPGNTCLSALGSETIGNLNKPINNSKGCGTVMRIAPIGLYFSQLWPIHEIGRIGAATAALTHGHPLAIIPSYMLAVLINTIVYGELSEEDVQKRSLEDCVHYSLEIYKENFKEYGLEYADEFIDLINKAIELSKKNINDVEAIEKLGEGWVADEALAIAIYSCLKYSNSFEDTIVCAVNHSGDSDSTGAIAGNIIGAYLGIDKIPNYYLEKLELKDIILEIANDLMIFCPDNVHEYSKNPDEKWLKKYLYMNNKE